MLAASPTPFSDTSTFMGDITQPVRTMTLIKQYKGLEFSQPVRLLEAKPESAILQATDSTLVPLLEGSVTLHSQAFSTSIVGHVRNLNYADGIFHFSDFIIQDWKPRQSERVQPKDPIFITLHWRQKEARLCLEDISTIGVGVFAGGEVGRTIKIRPGLVVHLDFKLLGVPFENLEAAIQYRQHIGQCVEKLGMRLFPSSKQRKSLEQYVAQRRKEILEDISEIYLRRRDPPGIESQYF